MHCQKCHKNFASVRYAEVVDGEVTEQHLCRECLNQKQTEQQAGFEFTAPSPFMRKEKDAPDLSTAFHKAMSCSTCAATLESITTTGEVGCSQCYETFELQIGEILGSAGEGLRHKGKIPRQDNLRAKSRADLQTKRGLLKTSLGAERYEEAAVLRDEIKQLEAGLNTALRTGDSL
jgi:protein arginine kinase activator